MYMIFLVVFMGGGGLGGYIVLNTCCLFGYLVVCWRWGGYRGSWMWIEW